MENLTHRYARLSLISILAFCIELNQKNKKTILLWAIELIIIFVLLGGTYCVVDLNQKAMSGLEEDENPLCFMGTNISC